MAGQTIGPRKGFVYTSDADDEYILVLDEDIGEAGGLPEYTTANTTAGPKPLRFKPRVYFCQAEINGNLVRKTIPCTSDNEQYQGDTLTVTIDTVTFNVTGRRGEKFSFGIQPSAEAPP